MMDQSVTVYQIDDFRALDAVGAVAGILRDANDLSEEQAQNFANGTYPKHVGWPGFRLFMAAIDGNPVGFVYGYRSMPGQWWHDEVRESLIAARYEHWVDKSLELAEIAVLPPFQNHGIGGMLMEAFLHDVHQPILLALEADNLHAHMLYTDHAFQDLITNFHYAGYEERIILMGRPSQGDGE